MTRKNLNLWTLAIVGFIVTFIFFLVFIKTGPWTVTISLPFETKQKDGLFEALKAAAPAFILVPGAWLAHLYQKRIETIRQLRSIYIEFCDDYSKLRVFCETPPCEVDHFDLIGLKASLSATIDKCRAVYYNIGETPEKQGEYPWEALRTLYLETSKLSADQEIEQKVETFEKCERAWRAIRYRFLYEMDRVRPDKHESARNPVAGQKLQNPDPKRTFRGGKTGE